MEAIVDWCFIEQYLDACFEDTAEQGRILYQEFIDGPSEAVIFNAVMSHQLLLRASFGVPRRFMLLNPPDAIPPRYRCVVAQKDLVAALARLCEELAIEGVVTSTENVLAPSTRLLYCLQQKYAYFGRGEAEYTDLFCAWAYPDQDQIHDGFVRRRKLQTLLAVIETP